MPQISPMSWISIVLIFCLSFLMVKTILPNYNQQNVKSEMIKKTSKKLSW